MSLRISSSSRLLLRPISYKRNVNKFARYTTSSPGNDYQDGNNRIEKKQHQQQREQVIKKEAEEAPVKKTIIATKAYIEKLQHDMKPRLEPYIMKLNNASEQLKRLTSDVSDSKEALQRASRALNELTGYDQIDAVKQKVNNQGKQKYNSLLCIISY